MSEECRFEQVPLNCSQCGAFIGTLGTCEDVAVCDTCNTKAQRKFSPDTKTTGFDVIYSPQDEDGQSPLKKGKVKR